MVWVVAPPSATFVTRSAQAKPSQRWIFQVPCVAFDVATAEEHAATLHYQHLRTRPPPVQATSTSTPRAKNSTGGFGL